MVGHIPWATLYQIFLEGAFFSAKGNGFTEYLQWGVVARSLLYSQCDLDHANCVIQITSPRHLKGRRAS